MLHLIAAPTRNRAALYAAGLGLRDDQWKPLTASEGHVGHFHILPGADHDTATIASRSALKRTDQMLVDLRSVA